MEQIQISITEYQSLCALKKAAVLLNTDFIPRINFGESFITAEAAVALNDFGIALREAVAAGADGQRAARPAAAADAPLG